MEDKRNQKKKEKNWGRKAVKKNYRAINKKVVKMTTFSNQQGKKAKMLKKKM